MNTNTLLGAGAVPLIIGIVQIFKTTGLPAKITPVIALLLGIAAGLSSTWQNGPPGQAATWVTGVVLGITWGLAASGLYQGGKSVGNALNPPSGPSGPPAGGSSIRAVPKPVRTPTPVPFPPSNL